MKRIALVTTSVLSALAISGCVAATDSGGDEEADTQQGALAGGVSAARVCPPAGPDPVSCHAHVVVDSKGQPNATTGPTGYNPADLQAAYKLPSSTAGTGQTVAIID